MSSSTDIDIRTKKRNKHQCGTWEVSMWCCVCLHIHWVAYEGLSRDRLPITCWFHLVLFLLIPPVSSWSCCTSHPGTPASAVDDSVTLHTEATSTLLCLKTKSPKVNTLHVFYFHLFMSDTLLQFPSPPQGAHIATTNHSHLWSIRGNSYPSISCLWTVRGQSKGCFWPELLLSGFLV